MSEPRTSKDSATLQIGHLEPFGVGGRRSCYVHPLDPSKCIKVLRTDERRTRRLKKTKVPQAFRREYDNNEHERLIIVGLAKRLGDCLPEHLPQCYGYESTDLGPGLVLDLVRDTDGKIGRSLRELFTAGHHPDEFKEAFDEFGQFLLKHRVLTRNLHDHNLIASAQEDGSWKLYLIDGLGDPAWLPLARWFPAIAKKKIQKRLKVAWPRFEAFWKTGGVTDKMRTESTWDQGMLRHR